MLTRIFCPAALLVLPPALRSHTLDREEVLGLGKTRFEDTPAEPSEKVY